MTATTLDIQNVTKRFGATTALGGASLSISEGEFVTLLGPSGSGKTTLLRLIVGFETVTSGRLLLRGKDISSLRPAERGVGMVFQQYALFPHMTVEQNIAYGLKLRGWSSERRRKRVQEMIELVRLDGMAGRYPRQLSGGQQQRVALARAIAYGPEILLMDEPLGALDRTLRLQMEEEIRRIHRDLGATVVYVTHDQQEALALSDRIAIMNGGRILAVGPSEDLYYRPPDSFVAGFFANSNLLPARLVDRGSNGHARVACGGVEVVCQVGGELTEEVHLSVRRRSLRRTPVDGAVPLRGTVAETLLFGDEREVVVESAELGRVKAVLDARDSGDIGVGEPIELFAPAEEAVVVSDPRVGT